MSVTDCGKVVATVDKCIKLMVDKTEHKLNKGGRYTGIFS